jgi:hypothetical protein
MNDKKKIELYIDWVNNFITLPYFARYRNLSEDEARDVIREGRELFGNRDNYDEDE